MWLKQIDGGRLVPLEPLEPLPGERRLGASSNHEDKLARQLSTFHHFASRHAVCGAGCHQLLHPVSITCCIKCKRRASSLALVCLVRSW